MCSFSVFLHKLFRSFLFVEIMAFFQQERVGISSLVMQFVHRAAAGQTHRLHCELFSLCSFQGHQPAFENTGWCPALNDSHSLPFISRKPFPSSESLRSPLLFHVRLSFPSWHEFPSFNSSITTLLPSASTVLGHFCGK